MKAITVACLICLTMSSLPAAAQQHREAPCPAVQLSGPDLREYSGGQLMFAVVVNGRQPDDTVIIKWSVSGGEIITGQGTPFMSVKSDDSLPLQCVTVTVEFDGLGAGCPSKATCASLVSAGVREPLALLERYGYIPLKQEKELLDHVASLFSHFLPLYRLRIVGRDGPNQRREKAARRVKRALDYLTKKRGIELDRIVLGPRDPSDNPRRGNFEIEFWVEENESAIPPCKAEP